MFTAIALASLLLLGEEIEEALLNDYVFQEEKKQLFGFDLRKELLSLKEELLSDPLHTEEILVRFTEKSHDKHLFFSFMEGEEERPFSTQIEEGTAILSIGNFAEGYLFEEVELFLQKADQYTSRLIIDLRGTTGGELQKVEHLAALLLKNPISYGVSSKERVILPKTLYQKPLTLYVDEKTASAAELFAAIIQDSGRGDLLGRHTAGSCGILKTVELSYGIALSFPYKAIFRPDGRLIEDSGIEPAGEIPLPK